MSDRFDPEAWPYPDEDEPANKASSKKQDDQDDYKSLDFDNPTTASNTQSHGDPYSDAPYSDVGYDDYGYKSSSRDSNPDYDAPSSGFGGRVAADDDNGGYGSPGRHSNGDDDFGSTGAYGQDNNDSYDDDDDSYGADDYDDDYDDEDDDYDDREPKQGGGLLRKLIGAGIVLALAGFAFFMFLTFTGGDDSNQVATPTTEAPPSGSPEETSPEQTSPEGSVLATQEDAPGEVIDGLNNALAAWGRFAVNGNLDEVRPYFAADGTQFRSFESEATALQASPPGGAPLTMTMTDATTLRASDDSWIIQGPVLVTREGEQDQILNWQIRMEQNDGVWQVATVANV